MKCAKCPLFSSWSNESDSGEACGLFGDGWDNPLQYEDKDGTIIGCYVDRHYIEQCDKRYNEHIAQEAASFAEWWDKRAEENDEGYCELQDLFCADGERKTDNANGA